MPPHIFWTLFCVMTQKIQTFRSKQNTIIYQVPYSDNMHNDTSHFLEKTF